MPGFESDEFALTDIAEYVALVAVSLKKQGLPDTEIQRLIDGYEDFILDEWMPDDEPVQSAVVGLVELRRTREPLSAPTVSLYGLSRYVGLVTVELLDFGYEVDDALDAIDDFDDAVIAWFPTVPARNAARRLTAIERRLAAGRGLNEMYGEP